MVQNEKSLIEIDLNQFKLHVNIKNKAQLILHFDSPSRRFYLSVIALVVIEMKRLGRITSIPMEDHHHLLALLNETVGGFAGSSDKGNLLPRIYRKWKDPLPNLEEASLFKVIGRNREYDDGIGKRYEFTEEEKDAWANLFEYKGSREKVRLRFSVDKLRASLSDVVIIYGEDPTVQDADAWDNFIEDLRSHEGEVSKKEKRVPELHDKPSIVVLPFANISEDPAQEYFSNGMAEDIITDLSKISGLLVISRNSAFVYKGQSITAREIAEKTGARYVLEGSVRKAEEKVRINVQLIDSSTGHYLWADRYDGNLGDVFALQDKITQKIVAALAVKLSEAEQEFIAHQETNNIEAHNAFLQGSDLSRRDSADRLANAVPYFEKAIELDPNYGRPYGALAEVYYYGRFYGLPGRLGISDRALGVRRFNYLQMAMNNPTNIAHRTAAYMYLFQHQREKAVAEAERALTLDPNDSRSNQIMAAALIWSGTPDEAVYFTKRAFRVDPGCAY